MVLNFDFIPLLELFENQPVLMVFLAAFGIFFGTFILFIPFMILRRLNKKVKIENSLRLVTSILLLCWVIGFVTQIILFFAGVSGIKLFFIWITMLFTYVVFGLFNKKMILKWGNTVIKEKT